MTPLLPPLTITWHSPHSLAVSMPYPTPLVLGILRGIPGAHWAPQHSVWLVPADQIATLSVVFGAWPVQWVGITPPIAAMNPAARPGPTWAATLFAAVGSERAEAVFRALARVLHPDNVITGDRSLMEELIAARPAKPMAKEGQAAA